MVIKMELDKLYEEMYLQVFKDNEHYTNQEMKKVYKQIKKSMNETIKSITDIFVQYGEDGKLNLSSSEKTELRQKINAELKVMGKSLAENEVDTVTGLLETIALETYYKTAFVMDYGIKTQIKFKLIRQEFIDSIVNMNFKGYMFSDRIWTNKDKMIKRLRLVIEDSMQGKKTVDQVARDIKRQFAVTSYQSQRLARTEMARVQAQAQLEIGKNSGVLWVMWLATLDKKTNPEDAALDSKRWKIDEEHPIPPLHPNCRCTLVNVPFEDWQPKKRKNNETKDIIPYKEYEEWKKEKDI